MQEVDLYAPDKVLEAAQVAMGTMLTAATTFHFKETDRQLYTHTYTHEREKERVFGNLPDEFFASVYFKGHNCVSEVPKHAHAIICRQACERKLQENFKKYTMG